MIPLLEARGAGLRVGDRWLVERASLSILEGEVLAIIGPNGAGKSTLLKLLSGELLPDAGQILLDGHPIRVFRPWQLAQHRALMAQSSRLGFSFTVAEVVTLGLDGLGAGLDRRAQDSILATCMRRADVLHLATRDFLTLSGGEQQRVHFARACAQLLAARPRQPRQVLMLDEPVASLDLAHQIALMRNALDLAATGVAVVAVLHDINLAVTFADRVLVMHEGKIAALGEPRSVVTRDLLRSVFAVDMAIDRLPRGGVPAVLPQNYACTP